MADTDCLRCHARRRASRRRRTAAPLFVDERRACSTRATPRSPAPSATPRCNASRSAPVRDDHAEGRLLALPRRGRSSSTRTSTHGKLLRQGRPERPDLQRLPRHARHPGPAAEPNSPTFPTNVPQPVRALPPRGPEGGGALHGARSTQIVERYTESIHGKGLLKSGLTRDRDLHRLPHGARASCRTPTRARASTASNVAADLRPVPPRDLGAVRAEHPLALEVARPTSSCRSATTATPRTRSRAPTPRASSSTIMSQCGTLPRGRSPRPTSTPTTARCRSSATRKTAKCYDCHGAHDILPPSATRARTCRARTSSRPARSATPARTGASPAT